MTEKIPMNDVDFDEGEKKKSGQEFVVTRRKAIALVVIVIVIIIFVGVISGIFSARKARKDALEEAGKEKREDTSVTKAPEPTIITPTTEHTGPEPWYKIRLPQNIKPIHYDLHLDPYLEENRFQGDVSILINVTEKSDYMAYILIHIKDMNVTQAKVYKLASDAKPDTATLGEELALTRTFEYQKNDFFVFELENDLEVGKYVLYMEYKSRFSSQLNGLYISTYTNEKGEKRWAVSFYFKHEILHRNFMQPNS